MTAIRRPALSAIAFQLAGALEAYQVEFEQLLQGRCTFDRCLRASRRLDQVLRLKGALPQLSAQVVELLARHTELLKMLWGAAPSEGGQRHELVQRHVAVIEAIRARCVRLFCRDAAPA